MVHDSHASRFARITPVDPRHAGRVLNFWSSLWFNLCSILCLVLFLYAVPIPFVVIVAAVHLSSKLQFAVGATGVLLSLIVLVLWAAYCYSEWPVNRWLCRRLLRLVQLSPPIVSPFDPATRVVELVPRKRWKKPCLDTATDLMMLRVDDRGVWMLGDYSRYEIPRESILSAEFHPGDHSSGPSPRVLLYVRTEAGAMELPIFYRDYQFGSLRLSRRRAQTAELADKINAIATGIQFDPLTDPEGARNEVRSESANPYQAPVTE